MRVKHLFPGLEQFRAYLNTASAGMLPLTSLKRVLDFLNYIIDFREGSDSVDVLDVKFLNETLEEGAKLMKVKKENIGLTIQTTEGLRRILMALTPKERMNIVSLDMEFPSLSCLLKSYSEKYKLELRVVKNKNGWYSLEEIEKSIDDKTFAVVISSTQWISGQRIDLKELSKIVHEHGAWLIVDAVQHLGSLTLFPKREGVDALVAGGEKWLLNPAVGSGLMYLSDEILEELSPLLGLLNMEAPTGEWGLWWSIPEKNPWEDFVLRKDAKKMDFGGGPPYLLAVTLGASLDLINRLQIEKIENHNKKLITRIRDEVLSAGLEVIGDHNEHECSSIITVKTGLSYEKEKKIYQRLLEEGIKISHRGVLGHYGLRISPHLYNDMDEVEIFLEHLFKYLVKL